MDTLLPRYLRTAGVLIDDSNRHFVYGVSGEGRCDELRHITLFEPAGWQALNANSLAADKLLDFAGSAGLPGHHLWHAEIRLFVAVLLQLDRGTEET